MFDAAGSFTLPASVIENYTQIISDKADQASSYSIEEIWPVRSFDPSTNHVWPIPNVARGASNLPK